MNARIEAIDALLPQTQCRRCGFEACRPYAEALARNETLPNRCPPGGDEGAARLAAFLNRPATPVDRSCGEPGPLKVARIREADCIGCTKCILACPVDAISGASRWMHAVIESRCTGCELCLPPCPTDCIEMVEADTSESWTSEQANAARSRLEARMRRLNKVQARSLETPEDRRRALVAQALERATQRRNLAREVSAPAIPGSPA
ncbi:MAG: RnfABCDGE type electron transport complex subunit B [Betaproteobacteria bacterium]|nr:RnfABCDGE type electron transport complex subunit B [Betaproteobacteria bacterium]